MSSYDDCVARILAPSWFLSSLFDAISVTIRSMSSTQPLPASPKLFDLSQFLPPRFVLEHPEAHTKCKRHIRSSRFLRRTLSTVRYFERREHSMAHLRHPPHDWRRFDHQAGHGQSRQQVSQRDYVLCTSSSATSLFYVRARWLYRTDSDRHE